MIKTASWKENKQPKLGKDYWLIINFKLTDNWQKRQNLTDNWQIAEILTDNWHSYPPIQTLVKFTYFLWKHQNMHACADVFH